MYNQYLVYKVDYNSGQRTGLEKSFDTEIEAVFWVKSVGQLNENYEIVKTYIPTY